jgi:hypothetical protein
MGVGGQVGERDSLINYMEHLHSKFNRCLEQLKMSECCPHFCEQGHRGPQMQGETLNAQPQAKVNFKTQDSQHPLKENEMGLGAGSRKNKKKGHKNKKRGRGEAGLPPRPEKMWVARRGGEFGHVGSVSKISNSHKV